MNNPFKQSSQKGIILQTLITGENYELKVDLNSEYREKRKEGVKKVISNMTIGKDVSGLFADVVKNMQTEDLELKKLVYLYLMNYAKSQPELVILAVNTFVKDSDDHNPLIRALAIRTMGCVRVEKIIIYLMDPLKKALADADPYVRKTAALCVAKLFDLNPSIAIENGFVTILQEMLADRNPMVIANAVSALTEINEASQSKQIFQITNVILTKLLAALNECTEWGQICILNSLSEYRPQDINEASTIIERVIPRLQHINASVVLSAVKLLMVYLNYVFDEELITNIMKKLAPSLVSLLAALEPEIQYVALRNINLILQKKPDILRQEIRVFFTKYNDTHYVKLEKLQVIIKLADETNIDQVLSELKEYSNEVDVQFVRKSIEAIGRCAIKIESSTEKCIQVILELIKTKIDYIVQECIIVAKDIFRKYPQQYEGIISILCENIDSIEGPECKSALIWIIGEYAERIDNAIELLEFFLETFKLEHSMVQLQLVTASVKLFLKKPSSSQEIVQRVLNLATQGNENPDIRDRAYIYWRLLSTSPQASANVVLAVKPPIQLNFDSVNKGLIDELIANIASLASVYYKPVSQIGKKSAEHQEIEFEEEIDQKVSVIDAAKALGNAVGDLLDLGFDNNPAPAPSSSNHGLEDLLGDVPPMSSLQGSSMGAPIIPPFCLPKTIYLDKNNGKGLEIQGTCMNNNGQPVLEFLFTNYSEAPLTDFAIQFNVNSFGIVPHTALSVPSPLLPKQSVTTHLPLSISDSQTKMDPYNVLQIAIKTNAGVYYFQAFIPLYVLFNELVQKDLESFDSYWNDSTLETKSFTIENVTMLDEKLKKLGISVTNYEHNKYKVFGETYDSKQVFGMIELNEKTQIVIKSSVAELLPLFQESLEALLVC